MPCPIRLQEVMPGLLGIDTLLAGIPIAAQSERAARSGLVTEPGEHRRCDLGWERAGGAQCIDARIEVVAQALHYPLPKLLDDLSVGGGQMAQMGQTAGRLHPGEPVQLTAQVRQLRLYLPSLMLTCPTAHSLVLPRPARRGAQGRRLPLPVEAGETVAGSGAVSALRWRSVARRAQVSSSRGKARWTRGGHRKFCRRVAVMNRSIPLWLGGT